MIIALRCGRDCLCPTHELLSYSLNAFADAQGKATQCLVAQAGLQLDVAFHTYVVDGVRALLFKVH